MVFWWGKLKKKLAYNLPAFSEILVRCAAFLFEKYCIWTSQQLGRVNFNFLKWEPQMANFSHVSVSVILPKKVGTSLLYLETSRWKTRIKCQMVFWEVKIRKILALRASNVIIYYYFDQYAIHFSWVSSYFCLLVM